MLNKVLIQGRFVRNPELRKTQSGKSVASFTLAVERDYAQAGQQRETDFLPCTIWGNAADFVNSHFSKGSMATVCGRIEIQNYTDRDGNKRTTPNIQVENIYFCGEKSSEKRSDNQASTKSSKSKNEYFSSSGREQQAFTDYADDDDLPF